MHALTKQNSKFEWSSKCDEEFNCLKEKLVNPPVLALSDFSLPFILDTDASTVAIASVLSQCQNGKERVIAYGSRTLRYAKKNYSATKLEMLAAVYFVKYYRPYLLGRKFTLRTDHGALTWLHSFRQPVGQVARWSEYKYDIIHRPGRLHSNVDPLSQKSTNEGIVSNVKQSYSIAQDQRNNLDILPAIELLENSSEKPSLNDISPYSHETKQLGATMYHEPSNI